MTKSRLDAEKAPAKPDAKKRWVVGPLGQRLTLDMLPPAGFKHWVPLRKAEVVAAVKGGLLTMDEVLQRYDMLIEEFASWQRSVERFGVSGLRMTRYSRYRAIQDREQKY